MEKKLLQNHSKRIFLVVCAILVISGAIYQMNFVRQGYWLDSNINVEELTVCAGIDDFENRLISPDVILKRDYPDQFVCGRIKSESHARLWFLFYKEDFEHQTLGQWFENEYFASRLYVKNGDPFGRYRVEIRQGRKLLQTMYYLVDEYRSEENLGGRIGDS